jgi:hypothetical protein
MHSVLPLLTLTTFVPCYFNSYKIINASVRENVSRFGRSLIEKDSWITDLKDPAYSIPFLIACKATSPI